MGIDNLPSLRRGERIETRCPDDLPSQRLQQPISPRFGGGSGLKRRMRMRDPVQWFKCADLPSLRRGERIETL